MVLESTHNACFMLPWLLLHVVLGQFPAGVAIKNRMNNFGVRCPELLSPYLGLSNLGAYQTLDLSSDKVV